MLIEIQGYLMKVEKINRGSYWQYTATEINEYVFSASHGIQRKAIQVAQARGF